MKLKSLSPIEKSRVENGVRDCVTFEWLMWGILLLLSSGSLGLGQVLGGEDAGQLLSLLLTTLVSSDLQIVRKQWVRIMSSDIER